jgi:hypothetical protein
MARTSHQVADDIRNYQPIDGDWRPLDALFAELWATDDPGRYISDLLVVLERFPEDDGAGVFWSLVHGLESLPGYEAELIRSVQRQPSEMGVTMIGRLLNGGVSQVGGVSLRELLQSVASAVNAPASVRASAADWAASHA